MGTARQHGLQRSLCALELGAERLCAAAEERGFLYLQAENEAELAETMQIFTQPEEKERPLLLEVFTNKNKDARMLKNYYHQLKQK